MKENNTYHENTGSNNLPNSLRVNPFIVPDNYFNELPSRILFQVKLEEIKGKDTAGFSTPEGYFDTLESQLISNIKIDGLREGEGFQVPQGYFDKLDDQVMAQVKIDQLQDGLTEVPQGYFENLADRIMAKVDQVELPIAKQEDGFAVPEGYFAESEDSIMASIAVEKLKATVGEDGFGVPAGYFNTLENAILDQVNEPKVIQMPAAKKDANQGGGFRKYAWISAVAAACVSIFVAVNTFNADPNNESKENSLALNEIPEEEILNYLSSYSDASDISEFAEYIYEPQDESTTVGSGIDAEDLKEYLNYTL